MSILCKIFTCETYYYVCLRAPFTRVDAEPFGTSDYIQKKKNHSLKICEDLTLNLWPD